jgi:hypothetical protein
VYFNYFILKNYILSDDFIFEALFDYFDDFRKAIL